MPRAAGSGILVLSSTPDTLESWLRLARAPGIGPRLASDLLNHYGEPDSIFAASAAELRNVPGLGPTRLRSLLSDETLRSARREIERAQRLGVHLIHLRDPRYPSSLECLEFPPLILSLRGNLIESDTVSLAVVGPRMPSEYARRMTRQLVAPLASRGVTIVSGLAQGIDAEAHACALQAGGRTLGVLGQGLDTPVHPSSNRGMAERIVKGEQGAILSVFGASTRPQPALYPQRNEIIAALSLGVLVVEAGSRSGALITARHALDFGRSVLACPGDADRPTASGSNQLLADGAILVQRSDDILEALGSEFRRAMEGLSRTEGGAEAGRAPAISPPGEDFARVDASVVPDRGVDLSPSRDLDALGRTLNRLLQNEHRALDEILYECAASGFGHGEVIERLLDLELKGVLRQMPGRVYQLSILPQR